MQSLQTLWSKTREILALMHMALGDPQSMFDLVRPSRKQAKELRAWLEPLEALVRKLLLLEAQALQSSRTAGVPPAHPLNKRIARREQECRRDAGGPRMPTARFVFPEPPTRRDPRICKGYGPRIMLELTRSPAYRRAQERKTHKRLCLGVRLGLRYAALINVIQNPTPFVKRLAKRLLKKPKLLPRLISVPTPRDTYLDVLLREVDRRVESPNSS